MAARWPATRRLPLPSRNLFAINGSVAINELIAAQTLTIAGTTTQCCQRRRHYALFTGFGNVTISGFMTFGGNITFINSSSRRHADAQRCTIGGSGNNAVAINTLRGGDYNHFGHNDLLRLSASSSITLISSSSGASTYSGVLRIFAAALNTISITTSGGGNTVYSGAHHHFFRHCHDRQQHHRGRGLRR